MEAVKVSLTAERFDEILNESRANNTPEHADLELAVKENATAKGLPGVAVSFNISIEGKKTRVQTVTTWRALSAAVKAIEGRLSDG